MAQAAHARKFVEGLEGKRAVVTGAGSGIGKAIAVALAGHGVRVAAADINIEAAEATAAALGDGAFGLAMDVSRRDSVEAGFKALLGRWGGFEILAANAGVSTMNRAVDLTDSEWDFNFDVNTRGVFLTNQAAARHFLAAGTPGVIVNTASLAAKVGAPFLAHYSASKLCSAGRRRWRASWRRRTSASTRSVPVSSGPPCRRGRSNGKRSCAASPPNR